MPLNHFAVFIYPEGGIFSISRCTAGAVLTLREDFRTGAYRLEIQTPLRAAAPASKFAVLTVTRA